MSQKIESDKLLVKDVFTKWYRIPEYQRPYVWGSDQVIELLDDVYQASSTNPQSQYFLGSMVLRKRQKKEGSLEYEEFDLLDGQQRLTTLFLLTAVVRDLTPSTNKSRIETCRNSIFQMENSDDNIPERMRIVFDIRDKVRDFINNFVKNDKSTEKEDELKSLSVKKDEDISIRNMANAILEMRKYFSNNSKSIDNFFPYLRSNVLMIYVAAEELEDAFHLFTVMNNRGIKLRNSDILKAENLALVKNEVDRSSYARKWENIEEFFGEDFDNFLSHIRTILVKSKAGYNLLKEFEENIYNPREFDREIKEYKGKPALLTKGKETFDFIGKYHEHYKFLFEDENYQINNNFEFHNLIVLMEKGFEADFWIAPLLRYYDKFRTNNLVEFLKKLDNKFSSDWIIGLTPTSRIENVNAIIRKIDNSDKSEAVLNSKTLQINIDRLIDAVHSPMYGRRCAKYIMLKVDKIILGSSTKLNPPETVSIEHILPRNPSPGSEWLKIFNESEREELTDKIGNLMLISRRKNSSLNNYDFKFKKEKYFKENIELFSNSIRIYKDNSNWSPDSLKRNHLFLLKEIAKEYGFSLSEEFMKTYE